MKYEEHHFTKAAMSRRRDIGWQSVAWSEGLTEVQLDQLEDLSSPSAPLSLNGEKIFGFATLGEKFVLTTIERIRPIPQDPRPNFYTRNAVFDREELDKVNFDIPQMLGLSGLFSDIIWEGWPKRWPARHVYGVMKRSESVAPKAFDMTLIASVLDNIHDSTSPCPVHIVLPESISGLALLNYLWMAIPIATRPRLSFRTLVDEPTNYRQQWRIVCFSPSNSMAAGRPNRDMVQPRLVNFANGMVIPIRSTSQYSRSCAKALREQNTGTLESLRSWLDEVAQLTSKDLDLESELEEDFQRLARAELQEPSLSHYKMKLARLKTIAPNRAEKGRQRLLTLQWTALASAIERLPNGDAPTEHCSNQIRNQIVHLASTAPERATLLSQRLNDIEWAFLERELELISFGKILVKHQLDKFEVDLKRIGKDSPGRLTNMRNRLCEALLARPEFQLTHFKMSLSSDRLASFIEGLQLLEPLEPDLVRKKRSEFCKLSWKMDVDLSPTLSLWETQTWFGSDTEFEEKLAYTLVNILGSTAVTESHDWLQQYTNLGEVAFLKPLRLVPRRSQSVSNIVNSLWLHYYTSIPTTNTPKLCDLRLLYGILCWSEDLHLSQTFHRAIDLLPHLFNDEYLAQQTIKRALKASFYPSASDVILLVVTLARPQAKTVNLNTIANWLEHHSAVWCNHPFALRAISHLPREFSPGGHWQALYCKFAVILIQKQLSQGNLKEFSILWRGLVQGSKPNSPNWLSVTLQSVVTKFAKDIIVGWRASPQKRNEVQLQTELSAITAFLRVQLFMSSSTALPLHFPLKEGLNALAYYPGKCGFERQQSKLTSLLRHWLEKRVEISGIEDSFDFTPAGHAVDHFCSLIETKPSPPRLIDCLKLLESLSLSPLSYFHGVRVLSKNLDPTQTMSELRRRLAFAWCDRLASATIQTVGQVTYMEAWKYLKILTVEFSLLSHNASSIDGPSVAAWQSLTLAINEMHFDDINLKHVLKPAFTIAWRYFKSSKDVFQLYLNLINEDTASLIKTTTELWARTAKDSQIIFLATLLDNEERNLRQSAIDILEHVLLERLKYWREEPFNFDNDLKAGIALLRLTACTPATKALFVEFSSKIGRTGMNLLLDIDSLNGRSKLIDFCNEIKHFYNDQQKKINSYAREASARFTEDWLDCLFVRTKGARSFKVQTYCVALQTIMTTSTVVATCCMDALLSSGPNLVNGSDWKEGSEQLREAFKGLLFQDEQSLVNHSLKWLSERPDGLELDQSWKTFISNSLRDWLSFRKKSPDGTDFFKTLKGHLSEDAALILQSLAMEDVTSLNFVKRTDYSPRRERQNFIKMLTTLFILSSLLITGFMCFRFMALFFYVIKTLFRVLY